MSLIVVVPASCKSATAASVQQPQESALTKEFLKMFPGLGLRAQGRADHPLLNCCMRARRPKS